MTFQPTSEQQGAIALFRSGANMAIEAGAGTGKTSTLALLAQASGGRKGQYIAFNKAIVTEAGERFPGSVNCATAHSLAFRAVGRGYAHRLKTPRMKSMDIAGLLRIDPLVIRYGSQSKPMAAGYLAGLVMRSVVKFCQTADPEPTERHVPYIDGIDVPDSAGRRTYANNDVVRAHVMPAVRRAWADICDRNGQLVFRHDHYLKIFQLSDPYIDADFILFDEAQDASPVLLDIVLRQTHAQLVFVGDSAQAIYGFTGAVDALDRIRDTGASTCFLTRSFRFGPAIADVANNLLERLGAELRLTGSPDVASVVAAVPEPDCILTRTNATSVQTVLEQLAAGRKVALVGGGREVLDFARAADDLKNGRWTSHPELACFQTWGDVQSYVEQDVQGGELRLLVNLVDEFGVEKIVAALGHNCVESDADVVVSTAHKAKGREWGSVQIAGDFKAPKDGSELDDEELRLLYVACTRARRELDVTLVPHATESPEEDIDDVPLPGFAVADDLSALEMTARYGTRQAPPA